MAPPSTEDVDEQLRDIIHNLYVLMIQSYDYHGPQTANAMSAEVKNLVSNLSALLHASRATPLAAIPAEIIEYVERGRNPDIYTREFVELAQKRNQELKGKGEAFAQFRDALAREIRGGMPDMAGEVGRALARGEGKGAEREMKKEDGNKAG